MHFKALELNQPDSTKAEESIETVLCECFGSMSDLDAGTSQLCIEFIHGVNRLMSFRRSEKCMIQSALSISGFLCDDVVHP